MGEQPKSPAVFSSEQEKELKSLLSEAIQAVDPETTISEEDLNAKLGALLGSITRIFKSESFDAQFSSQIIERLSKAKGQNIEEVYNVLNAIFLAVIKKRKRKIDTKRKGDAIHNLIISAIELESSNPEMTINKRASGISHRLRDVAEISRHETVPAEISLKIGALVNAVQNRTKNEVFNALLHAASQVIEKHTFSPDDVRLVGTSPATGTANDSLVELDRIDQELGPLDEGSDVLI